MGFFDSSKSENIQNTATDSAAVNSTQARENGLLAQGSNLLSSGATWLQGGNNALPGGVLSQGNSGSVSVQYGLNQDQLDAILKDAITPLASSSSDAISAFKSSIAGLQTQGVSWFTQPAVIVTAFIVAGVVLWHWLSRK